MADDTRGGNPGGANRGGPNRGGPNQTGPRRDGPGGGGPRRDGPGGPRKGGGKGAFGKGPAKPVRVETYESLKELTRGEGFRIDKFQVAEKGTHRIVKTEYRLIREGLKGTPAYSRLVDAQEVAVEITDESAVELAAEAVEEQAEIAAAEHAEDAPVTETADS